MEEQPNLLDGLEQSNQEVQEYRRKYSIIKWVGTALCAYALLIYLFFIQRGDSSNNGFAYSFGAFIGMLIACSVPASILSSILSLFLDKNFPYKERFRKFFWLVLLPYSFLLAGSFTIVMLTTKTWIEMTK